jgi:hypothetical protein
MDTVHIAWTLFTHVILPLGVLYFLAACAVADQIATEQAAGRRMRDAMPLTAGGKRTVPPAA